MIGRVAKRAFAITLFSFKWNVGGVATFFIYQTIYFFCATLSCNFFISKKMIYKNICRNKGAIWDQGFFKRWYVNNVQGTYILFLRNIQMMYLDIFESLMCRWWEAQNNNRFLKYSNIIKKWATSSYLHIIYVISRQLFILKLYLPIVDVTQQCSSNNVKTYSCFLCIMSSVVNFEIAQYYLYGIYIDEQWFGKLFLLDVMLYCSIILYHQF